VGLQYLAAWPRGRSCVLIYNLMEDAATAKICRAQIWQWVKHSACLNDCRRVTARLVKEVMMRQQIRLSVSLSDRELALASRLYEEMIPSRDPIEFLTLHAYGYLDYAAVQ
jgi:malate synthase